MKSEFSEQRVPIESRVVTTLSKSEIPLENDIEATNDQSSMQQSNPMQESKEETLPVSRKVEFSDAHSEIGEVVNDVANDTYAEEAFEDVGEDIPLEDHRPSKVQLMKIATRNLRPVELQPDGKNDPWVKVSIGNWSHKSTIMEGAGRNAIWRYAPNNKDMTVDLSSLRLLEDKVIVEVYDSNLTSEDTLIGRGEQSFERLLGLSDDEGYDMHIKLTDEESFDSGEVTITFVSYESNKPNGFLDKDDQNESTSSQQIPLPEVNMSKQESNRISLVKSDDDFKDYLDNLSDDDGSYEDDFG